MSATLLLKSAASQDLQELYDRLDQNFKITQLGQKDGMATLLRQAKRNVLAAKKEPRRRGDCCGILT